MIYLSSCPKSTVLSTVCRRSPQYQFSSRPLCPMQWLAEQHHPCISPCISCAPISICERSNTGHARTPYQLFPAISISSHGTQRGQRLRHLPPRKMSTSQSIVRTVSIPIFLRLRGLRHPSLNLPLRSSGQLHLTSPALASPDMILEHLTSPRACAATPPTLTAGVAHLCINQHPR